MKTRFLPHRQCLTVMAAVAVGVMTAPSTMAQLAPDFVAPAPEAAPEAAPAPVVPEVKADTSALGVRQQRVKRMLLELEKKFAEISEKLKAEQPDQAEKLDKAFRESKEMLLAQRMDEITRMLDGAKLETATEEQEAMIADVKNLINMLLAEEETDQLAEDLKELQQWKEQLDKLIAKEKELQKKSEITDNKEGAMRDIDERIADLKDLIARQGEVKDGAEKASGEKAGSPDELDKLADEQAGVRKDTEEMAEELARQADEPAGGEKPSEPGLQALREAAGNQKGSESELGEGKPKEAGEQANQAQEKLGQALKELEEERERIAGMDPEKSGELAAEQDKAESETGELKEQIAQSKQAAEGAENLGQAQQKLGEAKESMGEASKDLAQQNPGAAAQDQDKAREELEKARDEIQKRIDELKEEQKMEQLVQLEAIFREMLERQKKATSGMLAIDKERQEADGGELKRALRIALRKWATEESELSEKADETFELIYEEDQSVVFRTIVENLQASLESVAALMEEQKTDGYVQSSQKEIELTLEELIAALEKAQDQQQAQNQKPGEPGQPGKQPLLPGSAELKLMRLAQLRVNRLTTEFDAIRPGAELDAATKSEVRKMAERQNKLALMATEMAARASVQTVDEID